MLARCVLTDTVSGFHTNLQFYNCGVSSAQEVVMHGLCCDYNIHAEEGINMYTVSLITHEPAGLKVRR